MTLYLKYRPQTIEELDSDYVRTQLQKILNSKELPHAFLFAGPRGVGKTSSARILAKVINCVDSSKPCNKCEQCLSITKGNNIDVIEMDAASNRGIDDIRSLRESIALSPALAHKKIYIIDEVHMLTPEACNALLKTLEEPPSHVVFILATTNPEKLPSTIHSRLTTINFEKATGEEIERSLQRVINSEKIEMEKAAIAEIAKVSDGSFRDAVKLLEQLHFNFEKITLEGTEEFLYKTRVLQIDKFFEIFAKGDANALFAEIERVVKAGGSIKLYIDQIVDKLHKSILAKNGIGKDELTEFKQEQVIELIKVLSSAKSETLVSVVPQLPLELAVLKLLKSEPKGVEKKETPKIEDLEKKVDTLPKEEIVAKELDAKQLDGEVWNRILVTVKAKNTSIEALLRASRPMNFDGQTLTLGVYYQFHKERLEASANRKTLEDAIEGIVGRVIRVNCTLTPKPQNLVSRKEAILTDAPVADIISAAKEIFGG